MGPVRQACERDADGIAKEIEGGAVQRWIDEEGKAAK